MSQPTRRARIAVINDDTAFLELMHDLLENEENHDVLICKEWANAYQYVKEEQPDLVWTFASAARSTGGRSSTC